jgi:hypothetical protein
MVGAGLPQIAQLAGDAKSYAERLFQFPTIENSVLPTPAKLSSVPRSMKAQHSTLPEGPNILVENVQASEPLYQLRVRVATKESLRATFHEFSCSQRSLVTVAVVVGPVPTGLTARTVSV